jgi:hypothetical protein
MEFTAETESNNRIDITILRTPANGVTSIHRKLTFVAQSPCTPPTIQPNTNTRQ